MRSVVVGLVLLMSSVVWGQKIPLNVKLGLWETTGTHTLTGQMPITPKMMENMTPEQRARVEEAMKQQANGQPRTMTYKSCLTKEELDRGTAFKNDKECTETPINSTSSKLTVKMVCEMEDAKADGTVEFHALSSEHVKGQGKMTVTGGGHTMNSNSTFDSKWIGSNCGSVK